MHVGGVPDVSGVSLWEPVPGREEKGTEILEVEGKISILQVSI